MKNLCIFGIVIILVLFTIAGSSRLATSAEATKYGGTMRLVIDAAPATAIGWPAEINTASGTSSSFCIETLLRADFSGNVSPWLAESYEVADDYTSVTFSLRKGVKFHDGSEFNAEVAKWNLDNTIKAKKRPEWASVDVIDNYTIRVNLKNWANYTLRYFDSDSAWMISKEAYDKNGLEWVRQHPVGTGPFIFKNYELDTLFKVTKNPDYWRVDKQGNQQPYLDGVEISFIKDQMTQLLTAQTGGLDVIDIESGKRAADMAEAGLEIVGIGVGGGNWCLIPDTANSDSPWSNKLVREAAEYAIDREAIASAYGYGYWQAPYQLPPRGNPAYVADYHLARKYDPEKAKQLIEEAGYAKGFDTKIIMNPLSASFSDVVVMIQFYLSKINIRVTIDTPQFSKYQPDYLMGHWHNALLFQVFAVQANINGGMQRYLAPKGRFLGSWLRTPEFTEKFYKSINSRIFNASLAADALDQLIKEAAIIPINETSKCIAVKPYVEDTGMGERVSGMKPEQIWFDKSDKSYPHK